MRAPKARRIVIAVYEGVSLLDLAGPRRASFGSQQDNPRAKTPRCSAVGLARAPQSPLDPPASAGLLQLGNHPNYES
jgi:hypothetical protein